MYSDHTNLDQIMRFFLFLVFRFLFDYRVLLSLLNPHEKTYLRPIFSEGNIYEAKFVMETFKFLQNPNLREVPIPEIRFKSINKFVIKVFPFLIYTVCCLIV